jgi:superfamily II DNA or RNA helicase
MIITNWFESRGLRVLKYQTDAIQKVKDSLEIREKTVLAACPSAGKTIMTIYCLEDYLKDNPNHKIMVLAHGTTILRTQFHDVLEEIHPYFTYKLVESFDEYDETKDVNVCLPQTLVGKKLSKINLLVVDEAHQFYFGEKMVKEIIKKTNPDKQLLLTGTPSIFIREKYPVIPVTLNTIFDEGMISDVYVEIATSSYNFGIYDYNQDDELKARIPFKSSETKKTLDDLIEKIVDKLKSIRGNEYTNILPEWLPTLKRLQKTMIACKSQRQATQVKTYFDKIGVKSALSISDTDIESEEIENFKKDDDCLVLIVVGRGILGFNYPELVNVVDMTTSQNVDRIYQLFCRVVRKHPKGIQKLFFKIAPNSLSDYYKYIMTGVLALSDEYYFTHYNGKNFNDMEIPVRLHTKGQGLGGGSISTSLKKRSRRLSPIDFSALPVFELFKDIYHKKDSLLDIYAYTTIRNVRSEFLSQNPPGYWTKEKCIESALNYKTKGKWAKGCSSAYNSAFVHKWLEECCSHMDVMMSNWTKELCIEDAKKYDTITEWINNNNKAYSAASRNGWLDECVIHMKILHESWTKEKCLEDARKYNNRRDWKKSNNKGYQAARANGWLEECCLHMKKLQGFITKKMCIESALKYQMRSDWKNNEPSEYAKARVKGWIDECCKHMNKRKVYWTRERCINDAQKYETKKEWTKNSSGAVHSARDNGWFEECAKHMIQIIKPSGYWTFEKCIESAKKYDTVNEWSKNEQPAYQSARKNGWIEECCKHMIIGKNAGFWTKEKCIEDAKKFLTRRDWMRNNTTPYSVARINGWLEECTNHMKNLHPKLTKERCIESAKKYATISEWVKNGGGEYRYARKNGFFDECIAHMIRKKDQFI